MNAPFVIGSYIKHFNMILKAMDISRDNAFQVHKLSVIYYLSQKEFLEEFSSCCYRNIILDMSVKVTYSILLVST